MMKKVQHERAGYHVPVWQQAITTTKKPVIQANRQAETAANRDNAGR